MSFDAAIDALELGALRRRQCSHPEHLHRKHSASRRSSERASDWRVLSVTNIEAYLGSFALGKQYITKIPAEVYAEERDELRCFGM